MNIPERILTCKPSTPLVITQELADELGIERRCTAGQIQELVAKAEKAKAKKAKKADKQEEVKMEIPSDETTNL